MTALLGKLAGRRVIASVSGGKDSAALVWTVTCLTLGGLVAWAVSACEPVIGEPVPVQVDGGFTDA